MIKPRLYVYDWKPLYQDLEDIFEVRLRECLPDSLEGIWGLVLHSMCLDGSEWGLIKEANERDVPIFLFTSHDFLLREFKSYVQKSGLNHERIYYLESYEKLFNKVRDVFFGQRKRMPF